MITVGIDIGGTKTHLMVRDADGVRGERVLPSDTWRHDGLFGDPGNAARLLKEADTLTPGGADAVVVGAHGCETRADCDRFASLLRSAGARTAIVVNDAELIVPASGHSSGIGVVVGTGSIVVGASAHSSVIVAGGHGWLLGDPGSAPALARDGVKAVLRHRDRGGARDPLGTRFMRRYGVNDEEGLIHAFSSAAAIGAWAAGAADVFDAVEEGSQLALGVIDHAAAGLARNVLDVVSRGAQGRRVVCAGGVISNQPRLLAALSRRLEGVSAVDTVELLEVAPVEGAFALARRHLLRDHAEPVPSISHQERKNP